MADVTWKEHAEHELARSGHRAGGARTAVLDLLAGHACCLSAQEIHERLRGNEQGIGIASVYRALDTLASLQLVHRVEVSGTAHYERAEPSGDHHHHAICDSCGKRDAFEDSELERAIGAVARRLGYVVGNHDVVLHGACPECARR
jgi:Fur family ferric uptake transcriptional regulator